MAEFHYGRHTGTRGNGKNAVFCAAYIRAEKQTCNRTGETIDFSDKHNVLFKKTYLPENAPKWVSSLDQDKLSPELWNIIEFAEKRNDSQLYIHDDIAIPVELKFSQAKELVDEFVKEKLAIDGVFADVAIHWESGNPHFHVAMPAYRKLTETGFSLKERLTPSQLSQRVKEIRSDFASHANRKMEQYNIDARIDHRSYADRGIDLVPMQKIGKSKYMNGSLLQKDKVAKNESIKATNLQRINAQPEILLKRLESSKDVFNADDIKQQAMRYNVPIDLEKHHLDQQDKSRSQVVSDTIKVLENDLGIFTEKDVNRAIFQLSEHTQDHQNIVTKLTQSDQVIPLGLGVDGRQTYTTKTIFNREKELRKDISSMSNDLRFSVDKPLIDSAVAKYGLNASQANALKHITLPNRAAIVTGFAGTGKSYMLKPAQEIWSQSGYKPIGVALSGVVAASLEKDTGITSYTVASIVKRLKNGEQVFNDKSIIVMDEMGMTNLESMQTIIAYAKSTGAKFVGIGDVEQTQSIGSGAPTRSMIEEIGTVTMTDVRRQKVDWQRDATVMMETQQTLNAFDLYQQHGHIHYVDQDNSVADKLVSDWINASQNVSKSSDLLVVTYTNESADKLNTQVRQYLISTGQLEQGQSFKLADRQANLSVGDRITFTKRDKQLGIENGYFGQITNINDKQLSVKIDGGETLTFSLNDYNHIKHGYAATIHKIQGASVEHCFALLDSHGWDRHLMLVAASRHKSSFNLYIDGKQFKTVDEAKEVVSRNGLKDHLSDYPVMFSRSRGHDVQSVSELAAKKLSGIKDKIHDGWLYVSNYERYLENQKQRHENAIVQNQDPIREQAKIVASYADQRIEIAVSYKEIHALREQEEEINPELWDRVYGQELQAAELAYQIKHGEVDLQAAIEANRISTSRLNSSVEFKERHDQIKHLYTKYQQSQLWDINSANNIINDLGDYQKHVRQISGQKYFDFMAQLRNQAAIKQYETALEKFGVEQRPLLIKCRDYIQYESTLNELRQQHKAGEYKDVSLQKTINATIIKRNEFATEINNHPELGDHFKVDVKQLQRHIDQHEKSNKAVLEFERLTDSTLAQPNHFKQSIAKRVKSEMMTYAPYFEQHFETGLKQINIENWHYGQQQALRSLGSSDPKAQASIALVKNYFNTAQLARESFAKHQVLKEKNSPRQSSTLSLAQHYARSRNQIAHKIMQDAHLHVGALSVFKIDTDKLSGQYRTHQGVQNYLSAGKMQQRKLSAEMLSQYGQYGHYIEHHNLSSQLKGQRQAQDIARLAKNKSSHAVIGYNQILNRYLDNQSAAQAAWRKSQTVAHKAEALKILSNAYHKKADEYAHKIIKEFDHYQPVLAARYPDQAKREKIVSKLESRADNHQKRITIRTYISPSSTRYQRELAAYRLNQDFKGHVALGYDEGLVWGSVNKTAYPEKVRQARAKLDEQYHDVFDSMQSYQGVCRQAADAYVTVKTLEKSCKQSLNLSEQAEIPKEKVTPELQMSRTEMFKLMAVRHEVAYQIREDFPELVELTNLNKENLKEVVPGYNPEKFTTHVKYHEAYLQAKERVTIFAGLSEAERLNSGLPLAYGMTQRIGKHRFHLQHHEIKESEIWQLSQRHQYQLDNAKLSGEDQQLHQVLSDYVIARDEAKQAWQSVRVSEKQGKSNAEFKHQALNKNALRDEKAYQASQMLGKHLDSPVFETFVEHKQVWRNIDVTKLVQSAQSHQVIVDLQRYRNSIGTDQSKQLAYEISDRYDAKQLQRKLAAQNIAPADFWKDAKAGYQVGYRNGLSQAEQLRYDTVLAYRTKSIKTAEAYAKGDRAAGVQLVKERNAFAAKITQALPAYEPHLNREKISLEKLDKHAELQSRSYQKSSKPTQNNTQQEVTVRRTWDANRITQSLMQDPVSTYSQIFGQPKKVSTFEARWTNGVVVTLKGNKAGTWYSFVDKKGGTPIQALMHEQGMNFVDALKKGAEIANLSESQAQTDHYIVREKQNPAHQVKIETEHKQKVEAAQSIWMGSQPLKGTLSERYLQQHRNIQATDNLEIRHWPKGAKWVDYNDQGLRIERINKIPAAVIKAEDHQGNVTAVQRVYLDEVTADKNTFMDNAKLSKGVVQGSAGIVQRGTDDKVIIAEGPETAATLAVAYPKSTVLTSFSVSNLAELKPVIEALKPKQIIIAADNDGENAATRYQIEESAMKLGDQVIVKYPAAVQGLQKTDWNDVLKGQGIEGVRMQFDTQDIRETAAEAYLTKHEALQDSDFSKYRYDAKNDQIVLGQASNARYDYHNERLASNEPFQLKEKKHALDKVYVCQNLQDAHAISKLSPNSGIILANQEQLSKVAILKSESAVVVLDNVQEKTHQVLKEQVRLIMPNGGKVQTVVPDIKSPHTHTSVAEAFAMNPDKYRMKHYDFTVKPESLTEKLFNRRNKPVEQMEIVRPKLNNASATYYLKPDQSGYQALKSYMNSVDQLKRTDTMKSAIETSKLSEKISETFRHSRFNTDLKPTAASAAVAIKHLKQDKPLSIKEQQVLVAHSKQIRLDSDTRLQMKSVVKDMLDRKENRVIEDKLIALNDQKKDLFDVLKKRNVSYEQMNADFATRKQVSFNDKAIDSESVSAMINRIETEVSRKKQRESQKENIQQSRSKGMRR